MFYFIVFVICFVCLLLCLLCLLLFHCLYCSSMFYVFFLFFFVILFFLFCLFFCCLLLCCFRCLISYTLLDLVSLFFIWRVRLASSSGVFALLGACLRSVFCFFPVPSFAFSVLSAPSSPARPRRSQPPQSTARPGSRKRRTKRNEFINSSIYMANTRNTKTHENTN